MPFVNGVYQPDQRSPLDRLFGYQQTVAKMQEMKRQQDMLRERQKILSESYQPGEAARTEYGFDQPQAPQQPVSFAGSAPNIAAALGIADVPQMQTKQIEAKPASFDAEGAIGRLYGAGDLEGAQSIINDQYKDALGNKASNPSASEKWYGNSKTIKGSDGKLYNQILSSAGNVKLVPVDGDMTGELKQMDIGGKKVWVNSYTGEPVKEFDVTPTDYQAFQMDTGKQADQAAQVEGAKVEARIGAENRADKSAKVDKAGDAITELNGLVDSLNIIPASAGGMKWENAKAFFTGGDPKIQAALGNIDRISGRMLEYANKLPGAASEADRSVFMASAGVLTDKEASTARKIAAAKSAIAAFQRMQAADRASKQGGPADSRPQASAPMPSLPSPAQHKGRTIRDTATGIRYQSNGSQWMRVK